MNPYRLLKTTLCCLFGFAIWLLPVRYSYATHPEPAKSSSPFQQDCLIDLGNVVHSHSQMDLSLITILLGDAFEFAAKATGDLPAVFIAGEAIDRIAERYAENPNHIDARSFANAFVAKVREEASKTTGDLSNADVIHVEPINGAVRVRVERAKTP